MNIYIHEGYSEAKLARAKRLQTIGMVLLVVSFLLSGGAIINSNLTVLVLLAYPFLLVGFPLWQIGRSTQRRFANAPKPDVLLNAEMKGFNNKYSLHHYIKIGETWVQHLLISPSGLIVMTPSDVAGPVTCVESAKGDKWKAPSNLIDRMAGIKPAIGNPSLELSASVDASRELLKAIGKPNVPVKGLILFTRNPDVQINGCSYYGVPVNEAKVTIRELQQEMDDAHENSEDLSVILTSDDRRKFNNMLAPDSVTTRVNTAPVSREVGRTK